MGFNNNFMEQSRVAPCRDCKTRYVTCHSICPSYQKWVREQKKHARQVRYMKKQHIGLAWNRTKY